MTSVGVVMTLPQYPAVSARARKRSQPPTAPQPEPPAKLDPTSTSCLRSYPR